MRAFTQKHKERDRQNFVVWHRVPNADLNSKGCDYIHTIA